MLIEEILSDFKDDLENMFEGYLNCLARFYDYSPKNILLIYKQMPNATQVASYTMWQKLGYQVKRGEKSIKIVCPVKFIDEETEEEVIKFRYGNVFDISQVIQKTTPKPDSKEDFDVKMAFESLMLATDSNIKIVKKDDSINWKGLYRLRTNEIFLVEDSEEEMFKILLHEKRHEIALRKLNYLFDRNINEIIAESAAYVASVKFDIERDIAVEYVVGYCKDKTCSEIESFLTEIVNVSKQLIQWVLKNSYLELVN